MFQSLRGAVPTALSCLLVSFPFVSAVQATSVEDAGTGSGPQAAGAAVNDSGAMAGTCLDSQRVFFG